MERLVLSGEYGARLDIDLCYACHGLWLDGREGLYLTPDGTVELFRSLHARSDDPRKPLRGTLACPRCDAALVRQYDMIRGIRHSYFVCPLEHGRFAPFSEFLKKKGLVRPLTRSERERVEAEVRQLRCSTCGAPVDVVDDLACAHCGSPVSVLDPDAVEKALRRARRPTRRSFGFDPVRSDLAVTHLREGPSIHWPSFSAPGPHDGDAVLIDLMISSIGVLGEALGPLPDDPPAGG